MDRRFWQAKRKIPILNSSGVVIPAFCPVTFAWDNGSQGIPSPWEEGKTIRHGQLCYPVSGGISETGYWNTLYAINGPFDIQPNSYGEASIDYPLPLKVDPDSFPITDPDPSTGVQSLGTWDEYITVNGPDAEGTPVCGVVDWDGVGEFPAASFTPKLQLWYGIIWDVNADGSRAEDRVLAIPVAAGDTFPYGARFNFGTGGALQTVDPGSPFSLLSAQTLYGAGLFQINLFCNVEIDTPGTAATINLGYTQGPAWNAPSSSGQNYIASASRQTPKFTVGDATDLSYYPNDKDVVTYQVYGYETISLSWPQYARAGDKIYLDLTVSQSCKVLVRDGTLWFSKIANNPLNDHPSFD